jgi:hypothetical protein
MRDILLKRGKLLNIHTLERKGVNEVSEFLYDTNPSLMSVRNGFKYIIELIADERAYCLPNSMFKCWKVDGVEFCELIKGRYRISCFKYPKKKLLLMTTFMKYQQKEKKEYKRALNYKREFDETVNRGI